MRVPEHYVPASPWGDALHWGSTDLVEFAPSVVELELAERACRGDAESSFWMRELFTVAQSLGRAEAVCTEWRRQAAERAA
jgi:hypothetical protein